MKATVQKIPRKSNKQDIEQIAELVSLYYPAYKYHEAKKLPYRRAIRMIKLAQRERARELYDLAQIVYSQQAKKNSVRTKILDNLKKRING